jgi:hypothetical protein
MRNLAFLSVLFFLTGCAAQEEAILANAQAAAHARCPGFFADMIDRNAALARAGMQAGTWHNEALAQIKSALDECNKGEASPVLAVVREADRHRAEIAERCKTPTEIGMSESQVYRSCWGRPDHVNRTETVGHVREQWVYKDFGYLYLDDGIVTAKQTRE